jgi:hypothetical protein
MVLSKPPAAHKKRESNDKPRRLTAAGLCFGRERRRREVWIGCPPLWEARRDVFIRQVCGFLSGAFKRAKTTPFNPSHLSRFLLDKCSVSCHTLSCVGRRRQGVAGAMYSAALRGQWNEGNEEGNGYGTINSMGI